MMKRDWELLFSQHDLREVLNAQIARVNDTVLGIDPWRFDNETDDLLAASIASQLVVSPVELLEDKIYVSAIDAKVDVSYDPNRFIPDRSCPFYVDGLDVTYHLPFAGDRELLRCRPNTFTLNPPRAVLASSQELAFPYDQANRDVAATKLLFQQDIGALKQWLSWVNQQVKDYNASLETTVRGRIQQRRQELSKTKADLAGLGYPVRSEAQKGPTTVPLSPEAVAARRKSWREHKRREYDVALSFAGENRGYVEQVAEQLVRIGVTVFYDRFEQVDLWGKDLAEHLGQVYSHDAHFVVIFASRHYAAKAWPNHEKQFALSRHLRGEKGNILPVRMDDTEIPGIPPTIAYLDARVLAPFKLAELIRQKVDSESSDT
ncbi:MAG: TIR domain-containing protein [Planctomycetota bacterium]